jgi:hypothetical protein
MSEVRISTEFHDELAALARDIDQHDHVKIRTEYGFVYFAIGLEPPVGEDAHYDEVVPELGPESDLDRMHRACPSSED